MDPAAVTPDSFNFVTLFMRADWVVKLVMLGLAVRLAVVVDGDPRQDLPLRRA